MLEIPEKLDSGDQLSVEELIHFLPALKEVPATLLKTYAIGAAVRRIYHPGDIVFSEGEFGSTAFYLVSGHVDIYIGNPLAHVRTRPRGWGFSSLLKKMNSVLIRRESEEGEDVSSQGFIPMDASVDLPRNTPIAYLGPGELFGEMTCRTYQPRSATVEATEDCVMVEMLRVILDMLVGTRDPDAATKATTKVRVPTFKGTSFKKQLDDQYRQRSLLSHLRSVPLFATLDLEFSNHLRDHAELVSCNKGQVICKQGEAADAFYLIRTGLVRVAQAMPGGEMVRTYLKRGEYFGEIGLLYDQVRTATCSALDAVDLVKIGKEDFKAMLERFPVVRATLQRVAEERKVSVADRKLPVGLQLDEFLNQGLFEAQNLLLIDLDHCTRCDACVNACADAHDGVTRLIRDGLRYDHFLVATACRSCRDPLCMTQCPVGSIRRKASLEIIIEDWCIGCTKCAELCPYGNINMQSFEVTKEVPAAEPKPAAAAPAAAKAPAAPATTAAPKPAAAPAAAAPAASTPAVGSVATPPSAPAATLATPPVTGPMRAASEPEPAAKIARPLPTAAASDPALPDPESSRGSKPMIAQDSPEAAGATDQSGHAPVPSIGPVAVIAVPAGSAATKPESSPAAEAARSGNAAQNPPLAATLAPPPAAAVEPKAAPGTTVSIVSPAPTASAVPTPPKPAPAAAGLAATKPAPAAPAAGATPVIGKKKMVKKKVTVQKATTCDLCTQLTMPSCVYACPHEAAMRVEPASFLSAQIGMDSGARRRSKPLFGTPVDRTTHR